MSSHRSIHLAVAALLAAAPAAAADHGFYAGGSYGPSTFRDTCGSQSYYGNASGCDDSDHAWKVFSGYQFNRNWGLEVAWVDLGTTRFEIRQPDFTGSAETSMDGITVVATGTVPLSERFALFAKAGGYFWQAHDELRWAGSLDSASSSGMSQVAGVGARLRLGAHFSLRGEVERYFSGDDFFGSGTDVDVATLGIVFEF